MFKGLGQTTLLSSVCCPLNIFWPIHLINTKLYAGVAPNKTMIPLDFQVTCLKVKVKPLFWDQYVVHFKYFNPLLTCFGQVLLLQRRLTWILHHGGAYMFLKHFLFCLKFTEKYQHFYQTWDGHFIEVENSTSSFTYFFGIYSKTITSFCTQRLNNLSWKKNLLKLLYLL